MDAKERNKLAGIFLMIHGGFQAMILVIVGIIYGGMGAAIFATARRSEDRMIGIGFVVAMIVIVAVITTIIILPQLIGGWKMIKERPNARIWGIIASIAACLSFPLGTAAGVFGLVFLFGEDGQRFYLDGGRQPQNYFNPPPHNWQ